MDDAGRNADLVRIETPEHVVFEYELAGPGSRVIAALIDLLLIGLCLVVLFVIALLAVGSVYELAAYVVAAATVAAFVILWGYPIFFELWMRGQTPGKRSMGLRVIQEGGYALSPPVVIARNLLRIVDFLPAAYFLGLVVMMLSRRYKRIGDFVAGTIVIRERTPASEGVAALESKVPVPAANEEAVAELRRAGVHRLDPAEVRIIEDFLRRKRSMTPEARRRLANQLADSVRRRFEVPPMDSERLLASVAAAFRRDAEAAEGGAGSAP